VNTTKNTTELARRIRINALKMVHRAKASHIASALSMCDILAVLYCDILKTDPQDPLLNHRDRFILSKGHGCVAVYSTLAELGYFPKQDLESYGQDFSWLMNHISHHVPGVEFSTGSLGHGLPFGVGKALACKTQSQDWRTFVMLGDGEMNEGANWEALMFSSHHQLNNLTAIIDYNNLQSLDTIANTLELEPLSDKLTSFGWAVQSIDGHNHDQISKALSQTHSTKPTAIIAKTIKGKGVSFMEDKVAWHYKNPNDEELKMALAELNDA
jgi:transketolase